LKNLNEEATEDLIEIWPTINREDTWLKDFMDTIMVPIEKPNATECADFRTMSLYCHAIQIMLRILTKRLTSKIESQQHLGDDQFGFRKKRRKRRHCSNEIDE
jgi:hypothetical protein